MGEIHFQDNYTDHSTNNGFQFEFFCERCHDGWRSEFDRFAMGTAENLLGAAESLFGGVFGAARGVAEQARSAGWSKAKDTAFKAAVAEAEKHFHRCPRCSNHYCDNCWNSDDGTCINCVPRLDAELATIRSEAKLSKAREDAYASATTSKADLEARVISCKDCGAPVGRAKFCPECGKPVSLTRACGQCKADIPTSSKFCPECGAKP
jgi:membrane protease subunit (stomatin/prohibitin family)